MLKNQNYTSVIACGIWLTATFSTTLSANTPLCEPSMGCVVDPPRPIEWQSPAESFYNRWQINSNNRICNGFYHLPNFSQNIDGTEITTLSSVGKPNGLSELNGEVIVLQDNQRLFANQLLITRQASNGQITFIESFEPLTIEQPTATIFAQSGYIDLDNDFTSLNQIEYFVLNAHLRGEANNIEFHQDEPYNLYTNTFTTCQPDNRFWSIKSNKLVIDEEKGVGHAYHAKLRLYDVPVMYTPYISFPLGNKRKTGLLAPSFGVNSDNGTEIAWPFYWNIAPEADATFTPQYMSKRGWQLRNEARYLTPINMTTVKFEYMANDRELQSQQAEVRREFTPGEIENSPTLSQYVAASDNRYAFNIVENGNYNNWFFDIDYTYASDDNYFFDLPTDISPENDRQLLQATNVRYEGENWDFLANLQQYQTLQPYPLVPISDQYRMLPQLMAIGDLPNQWGSVDFFTDAEFVQFKIDTDRTQGQRLNWQPTANLPYYQAYGYLLPQVTGWFTHYDLELTNANEQNGWSDNPNVVNGIFSLDSTLFLERPISPFGYNYTQTLEPRLYYVYIPYVDQDEIPNFTSSEWDLTYDQLFRPNRFSGRDRIGDTNQISAGLKSRLYNQSGAEKLSMAIGQQYYFSDRRVQLSPNTPPDDDDYSPLLGQVIYNLNRSLSATLEGQYDLDDGRIKNYSVLAYYRPSPGRSFQVNFTESFVEQRDKPSQKSLSVGARWEMTPRINLLGYMDYNFNVKKALDRFAGIEYNTCCWATRIGWRGEKYSIAGQSDDYYSDNTIYASFILKGLSELGSTPDTDRLTEKIAGYDSEYLLSRYY